jgi:hypothetical protein
MKNMKISICAILMALSLSSFAGAPRFIAAPSLTRPADDISGMVRTSFKKEFKNAEIISCDVARNLTTLTFAMNGVVMSAFYSNNGELLAISRNILTSQLPLNLMLGIKENYKDYWVIDLFEMSSEEENAYYITLENASSQLVLKSVDNSSWEVYKKTSKD